MGLRLPYKRTVRQFKDNNYQSNGNGDYVSHPDFAEHPEHYIRAFLLIQKDLHKLFDYIEPSDINLRTYSYRIHELLTRTCIEIEANFKAILLENGYRKKNRKGNFLDLNITDYKKINITHRLSSYEVQIPNWIGCQAIRKPFKNWEISDSLPWYRAYNDTKHDRHNNFHIANFENLIEAVSGLIILLSSQFITDDFSKISIIVLDGPDDGFEEAIGDFFRVKFPSDWKEDEKYDFNWHALADEDKKILKFDYNSI